MRTARRKAGFVEAYLVGILKDGFLHWEPEPELAIVDGVGESSKEARASV